ncbi:hypothetical protein ACFUMH_04120 [Cellulomonas sp. NPDC057328]|uniref:hypothetical protein n=1 Tax=Cellulomonas sp. NPDC057328 TaxID=3346101 RepID=UPI0036447DD0
MPWEDQEESTTERLYLAAQHHARRARELVEARDRFDRIDAAYHAGGAVEMMAKALVSHLDERLLADQEAGKHHFLDVLVAHYGREDVGSSPPKLSTRAIPARMAVDLAARLSPECRREQLKARAALEARNRSSHMAELDEGSLAEIVTGMAAYVGAGVQAFHRAQPDFWGSVEWDNIRHELDVLIREGRASAQNKLAAAKSAYSNLISVLAPEKLSEFVIQLESRPAPAMVDDEWRVTCPACGHQAWLLWNVNDEPMQVAPDVWESVDTLSLVALSCPVCGLHLNGDEVDYTDVDTSPPREAKPSSP